MIFRHQYWRLLAALFLHYGPIHIFFNLFALLLLGPALERQIGGFLFAVCYLVSGIGSSIAVVLLTKLRLLEPVQLVGASGCIMGVVGTWTGFLLRHRHAPLARQRLRNIFVIVLLQLAFDVVTPRVSMSAHLGGLFTGFLLGLLVPAKSALCRALLLPRSQRERTTCRVRRSLLRGSPPSFDFVVGHWVLGVRRLFLVFPASPLLQSAASPEICCFAVS